MGKLVDLTGIKFGMLTVNKRVENQGKHPMWACTCECGKLATVRADNLKKATVPHCGCQKNHDAPNFIDITNQIFDRLTVLHRVENNIDGDAMWLCECSCGSTRIVKGGSLRSKTTRSCGCLFEEIRSGGTATTHGQSQTSEYSVWSAMKQRCNNENIAHYDNYGGRGISVCNRWNVSFETFISDMGRRPSRSHTIERIDNNGNYEPSNCKWATYAEQNRNKRDNVYVTINGKTMVAEDWGKQHGLPRSIVSNRIKIGMTHEEAVYTPLNTRRASLS